MYAASTKKRSVYLRGTIGCTKCGHAIHVYKVADWPTNSRCAVRLAARAASIPSACWWSSNCRSGAAGPAR